MWFLKSQGGIQHNAVGAKVQNMQCMRQSNIRGRKVSMRGMWCGKAQERIFPEAIPPEVKKMQSMHRENTVGGREVSMHGMWSGKVQGGLQHEPIEDKCEEM